MARRRLAAACLGALAGLTVFVLLYGTAVLDTGWDAWILNGYDESDIQQHYAGWLLFRNAHWSLPLGLADTLASPDGTLISYTDSLPWVSIFFKALRGVLPGTFQWFGWYTLLCFVLQGAAGALLASRGMLQKRGGLCFALLGGALFACLPTLWERAFRHVALASHWLYLWALYFYFEQRAACRNGRVRFAWPFVLLAWLAVGIHPYFLPLVAVCALLAAWEAARAGHGRMAAAQFACTLAAALAGGWLCGAIGGGVSASRAGYGDFSMNLNAPFNPTSRGGYTWSLLLPVRPQQPGQYDGFNYLGLGVLLLTAGAMAGAVWTLCRHPAQCRMWWRRNAPLFAACLLLTLFAASHKIFWDNSGLTLPLPAWMLYLCGIFRSSGRMFYLVGACILLFGLYSLRRLPGMVPACLVLAAVLAVQAADLSAVAAQKHAMLARTVPINSTVVNQESTQSIGAGHTKLLAAAPVREDRLRLLAVLAGKQGLATNLNIAVSGEYPGAERRVEEAAAALAAGEFDPSAVYVTTDEAQYQQWQVRFANREEVRLFVADSCYFLCPVAGGV